MVSCIYKLEPKEYDLDSSSSYINSFDDALTHRHFGLLAQDVKKLYPELVSVDDHGVLNINYIEMIPILIGAIKQQQNLIDSLIANNSMTRDVKSAPTANNIIDLENKTENKLFQNAPNPFIESTFIQYFIEGSVQSAMINIYDMRGTQLNSFEIHRPGHGSIRINGGEYYAGMYLYTLIADGQAIDTKQMILTD